MVCRRRPGPRRRELQRGRRQGGGKGVGCDCERLRTRLPTNDAAALYRFLLLLRLPLSTTTVGVDEVFNVLASPPINHRAFLRLFSLFCSISQQPFAGPSSSQPARREPTYPATRRLNSGRPPPAAYAQDDTRATHCYLRRLCAGLVFFSLSDL